MRGGKQDRIPDGAERGLQVGMPVATPQGWRIAGALRPDDLVWTPDGPPQPIRWVRRGSVVALRAVLVPEAALGNPGPLVLLPGQPVALDLDAAADVYGDPVVLVPALALVGWRGIGTCRVGPAPVLQLGFARRQVIYAGPGLLLGCEGDAPPLLHPGGPPAPPLSAGQAARLMACVMAQEVGNGLRRQAALAAVKRP